MELLNPFRRRKAPDESIYRHRRPALFVTLLLVAVAVMGAVQFRAGGIATPAFGTFLSRSLPAVVPSMVAFGPSGDVLVRFAMPNEVVEYPLEVHGDPTSLEYGWVRVGDSTSFEASRPLAGATVQAPPKAGFYKLEVGRGSERRIVEGLTLAVLVPFVEKDGTMLNGYRIGTYLAEKIAGNQAPPEGFLEITPRDVNIQISRHLRVRDFLNDDNQETWPRYAAINPRLLDKIELVIGEITRWHGSEARVNLALDVKSGFRAPDYNRRIRRAARDSQHQYGDAADVAIDANGDGKYSAIDSRMVGLAVEIVELKHPNLVGGLGIYTSGHTRTTYVHIDARGKRARWRG
ncbi:MAG TPA: D-Ala-D-Ala carboxypeptidase family metallohydrolase [Gemmatimonadaceae bacterium]|nr:D-Ala-D-Ala carboxypeptidase family metallohydrolase [Gemmatimonadaceae bacterium]